MWKRTSLLVLCILLTSCSNDAQAPMATLTALAVAGTLSPSLFHFASNSCVAPCWQGITPQITDKTAAETIMDGLIHSSVIGQDMRFYNGYEEKGYSVELDYEEEKVYLTRVYPSIDNRPLLSEVIDFLGPPDRVCLLAGTIPDSDREYETHILYLNRGIWLSSRSEFEETDGKGQLVSDLKLTDITFFSPQEQFKSLEGERTVKILEHAHRWEGYVDYEVYSKY
jgi:hypothetical protein